MADITGPLTLNGPLTRVVPKGRFSVSVTAVTVATAVTFNGNAMLAGYSQEFTAPDGDGLPEITLILGAGDVAVFAEMY